MCPLPDLLQQRLQRLRSALVTLLDSAPPEGDVREDGPALTFAENDDYMAALVDLLACLGAAAPLPSGQLQLSSPQVGYLLKQVIGLLDLSAPVVDNWTGVGLGTVGPRSLAAVDLCAALEQRRISLDPAAPPIRALTVVIGIIVSPTPTGERHYLLSWDAAARAWQLVGGRVEASDPSLQRALVREISEELWRGPLEEERDLVLTEIAPPFTHARVSPTYGVLSSVTFHAFHVRFLAPLPPLDETLRWVSAGELEAGRTHDGQLIASGPFHGLVRQAGTDSIATLPASI